MRQEAATREASSGETRARLKTFLFLRQTRLLGNELNNPVVIVYYDPQWPTLYEKEKELIRRVLGHRISAIEHIGSTAVPNLGGKNIIDIMAGISSFDEANECLPPLESIGYKDVTPQPDDVEWYYCLGKSQHGVGYHLHLVKFDSEHWKKLVIFRDFLRKNPQVAQEYYNLKKELAAKYGTDHLGYTEAKSAFIKCILIRGNRPIQH
jgi:GrpB-like predicted nucleotidyltransferase (UPF0157 family)